MRISKRLRHAKPVAYGALMILAAETALAGLRASLPVPAVFHVFDEKKIVARDERSYDALFFGDSSALHGMAPDVFAKRTGLASYNFATYAPASGFANVWLLKEYLDRHPSRPPKFLVLIVNVRYLATEPSLAMYNGYFRLPALGNILENVDPWYAYDPRRALEAILPSYRHRKRMADGIGMLLRGEKTPSLESGYLPIRTTMSRPEKQLGDFMKFVHGDGGTVQPAQAAFLQEFCRTAMDHGLPVFIKIGPMADVIMGDREAVAFTESAVRSVQATVADWPNCLVDPRAETYAEAAMENTTHANSTGALALTNLVVDRLQSLSFDGRTLTDR